VDFETGKPRGVTNSAAHIKEYIEGTIERLGFTPDLYYLHRIDPKTKLEDSIPALDEIRKEGKTRYIGLSECSAATLRKADASMFPSLQHDMRTDDVVPSCTH
jgi:aryl-alcohol dehydrogenase-like predicted oxidoreductase